MLELDRRINISITMTQSFSTLDESLICLEQGLVERINKLEGVALPCNISSLTIDIGLLGMCDHEASRTKDKSVWQGTGIYPLRLYQNQLLLGPLYVPAWPDSPCPHCLERRWYSNRPKEEHMALRYAQKYISVGNNPFITPFALDTLWITLVKRLSTNGSPSINGEYPFDVIDLTTLALTQYHLLQDSACPVCPTPLPDTPEAATIHLASRIKPDITTYHLTRATDYELPMSSLLNPISGVLGTGALADQLNTLSAPVTGIFHVRSKFASHDAWWSGHGNDYYQSLYLGVLEGIERYVGHAPHGKRSTIIDSYENLSSHALDPRECGVYDESFYQQNFPFYVPFTPTLKIPWVWGYSFQRASPILVPEQLVYYLDYYKDHPTFVQECSNGCATGSCLEEAIFYGLLELMERDAFMITWYAQLAPPRIDPRSCCRRETLFALEGIERLGYQLYLFDTRLDVRVPSVLSVAKLREPGLGNIVLAAGASLDPEDAIRGALCEVACYIPDFRRRLERDLEATRAMVSDYTKVRELKHHALLHGLPEMEPHSHFLFKNPLCRSLEETYSDWEEISPRNRDLRDDVLFCIDLIMQQGLDVIVVDQTSPEQARTGLRTVCVIVPGLLPIDFGWHRARVADLPRLRTVPRTAGYQKTDFKLDPQRIVPHPFP